MNLIIKEAIETKKDAPRYVIEVKMMHGDDDHYSSGVVSIPKERKVLIKEVIGVLDEMLNLPWNGARQKYFTLPGFLAWFGDEFLGKDEDDGKKLDEKWSDEYTYERWGEIRNYSFNWHRDVTCLDVNTRIEEYSVFYYDENNVKYKVEIKNT